MDNKEVNQGYEIKERYMVGSVGIALGFNPKAPSPYVTWNYRGDAPMHFFWGHYFAEKQSAYDDYEHRIESEIEYYENHTQKTFPLPMVCLSVNPSTGDIINIKLGQSGYYPSDWNRPGKREYNRETADFANEKAGITKAQEAAMLHGSMFGWHTKAAELKHYDENGKPKRIQRDEPER